MMEDRNFDNENHDGGNFDFNDIDNPQVTIPINDTDYYPTDKLNVNKRRKSSRLLATVDED